tara:strand:- start:59 stop:205 length:147 start_codon:yes stop_codon:yes gene_type:complete
MGLNGNDYDNGDNNNTCAPSISFTLLSPLIGGGGIFGFSPLLFSAGVL